MGSRLRYLGILLVVLLSVHCVCARTIEVGSSGGYTYATPYSGLSAAVSGDTVIIHEGIYNIQPTSPLMMKSGVTVTGDGIDRTILYAPTWTTCTSSSAPGYVYFSGVTGASISNLTIRGPATSVSDQAGHAPGDYGNSIVVRTSTQCTIHDIYFTMGAADCVKSWGGSCTYINVYNCYGISNHDFVQLWSGRNWNISNCNMTLLHNSGVRFAGCQDCQFLNSTVTALQNMTSGYVGVELENPGNSNLLIDHNIFHDLTTYTGQAGVWGLVYNGETGTGTATVSNCIFWNCPGGYIVPHQMTITDTGNTKGTATTNVAYWVNLGYGFNASKMGSAAPSQGNTSSGVYNGSQIPTLITPTDGQTVTTVNNLVQFRWSDLNSTNYRIIVSSDPAFSVDILYNQTTTDTGINLAVNESIGYYWKVLAHDDVHNSWVESDYNAFMVTGNTNASSGIYGIISDSSTGNPIQGAVVTIWNSTSSATYTTGADGSYQFTVPSGSGTYELQATATYYQPSLSLPITIYGDYNSENIALSKSPSYFSPHYCNIYVFSSYIGGPVDGAVVSVYELGNNYTTGTPDMTANTSNNGEVSFEFTQDQQYTVIVTYNGYTDIELVSGNHENYYIYLNGAQSNAIIPEQFDQYINIQVSQNEINDTAAYVNVSYADSLNMTTGLQFFLGQTNDTSEFTSISSSALDNSGNDSVNYSFIVTNYIAQSYVVEVAVNHTIFGNVEKSYPVRFPGSNIPFIDNIALAFLAIFVVFTIASIFSVGEHASGAVIVCMFTWFFWILGCFRSLGTTWDSLIFYGLLTASANAVIALVNDVKDSGAG